MRTLNILSKNERKSGKLRAITRPSPGVASFPGHPQILSHSHGEKSGEGLGSLLHHGPEIVDMVSTNRVNEGIHTQAKELYYQWKS